MNGKKKNHLENVIILTILGSILYGIYSFLFSPDKIIIKQEIQIEKPTAISNPIIHQKIPQSKPKIKDVEKITQNVVETTKAVEIKDVEKLKPVVVEINEIENIPTIEDKFSEEIIEDISKPTIETKITVTPKSTNTTKPIEFSTQEQKNATNIFLGDTKSKILNSILNQSKVKLYNSIGYVKIRVTILKDGNFEHLKYMGGDKEFFNSIQDSIKHTFPIYIDEQIRYQFPRYFRMRIDY